VHPDDGPLPLDLYAFGRGLGYVAGFALIGACVFAALIPRWRSPADDDQSLAARALATAWQIATVAPLLLLVAHLLRAYGQARSFLDPAESLTWDVVRPVLFSSTWGRGWMTQVAAALIALPLARLAPRRPAAGLALLCTGALAVAAAAPLTGHAVEHPWGAATGVGLHTLHLLGGGVWIGTLFTMVWGGLRSARDRDAAAVARMVAAFSPVALAGAALAVGAGTLLGVAYVGNLAALWGTRYGVTLLVKVGLLGVTMALGAWNWRRVRPELGAPSATTRLRRSATIELGIAVCLLAVTAVLVALPAPKL
jgi:putative copper export protein